MELIKTLLSVGLNKTFLDNPAFDLVINDIEKVIDQMNCKEIKPIGNSIYLDDKGVNINISIENGNIKYLLDKHKEEITEVEIVINNNEITTQTNYAMISNHNLPLNKCNITNSASKEIYNEYGIMTNKEYKLYKPRIVNNHQDNLSLIEILQQSREAFDEETSYNNSYIYREYAKRMQIDIARVYIEDKLNGREYASEILLENNYQKININIKDYGEKEIGPLTIEEIEKKIKTEHNPKVQEGLRKLSKTRDSYEYKTLKDPNFISKGYGYSRSYFNRQKVLKLSIVLFVLLISIVYALFSQTLNINGTGVNRKSNFDIYFNNVSDFNTTGTASVIPSSPTSKNHTTVIEDYNATLLTPGDSIYFTFDIVNDGDYDATLTGLTLGPVKCSVNGNENDPSAINVCSNIEYTMKYTNSNSNVSLNDTLASKETKSVKVTLTYNSNISSSDLPTSNVTISNLGIDMVYEADSEAKTNSDGSTPYDSYPIGTEVTVKNEKYNVIGQGEDYVTLLKQQPLTVAEVNTYGGVGTDNNHVNMYVTSNTSYSYYHQAYDSDGYGGMAYYSSLTCGYNGSRWVESGCTRDYNSSEVKYVVDAWASNEFQNNELKEVDNYKARLVQKEELRSQFYPSCSSTANSCLRESSTPSWLYSSSYYYWTMSKRNSSSTNAWHVDYDGNLYLFYVYDFGDAVRPVINIYKSKI